MEYKDYKIKKSIDEPLIFIECLQLIDVLIKNNFLVRDKNNKDNIIVYREKTEATPEGWYSLNVHDVARELYNDVDSQVYLRNVLLENNIEFEIEDVVGKVNDFMKALGIDDNVKGE